MELKAKTDVCMDCHFKKRQCCLETPMNDDYPFTWKQCYSGKISKEISRGSFAAVYKARTVGNTRCAIKMPHPHILSYKKSMERYKYEIEIHSTLDHPSIVSFYGTFSINDELPPLLVMERMWISMYSFIEQRLLGDFLLLLKLHILLDVAKGLSYLHSRNIIHRDVHLSNILLTTELNAKLSDFGVAQQLGTTECNPERCSVPGNPLYMSPETFDSNPVCGLKLDIFSFGCNFCCIINETIPHCEHQFSKTGVVEMYLNNMPSDQHLLKELAASCLAYMPEHRPDIECVVKVLNTIISSNCIAASNVQKVQTQYAPGVQKGDINIAQAASRKRLKVLKEHSNSKAIMYHEILATNGAILKFLKHNSPESGQHSNWLFNLATNFNIALTEAYMYQTYLEKYLFSSKPCFFELSFIQSNATTLSINTVANAPTTAYQHVTYFVAFSQSRLTKNEVFFVRKQVINVSTLTNVKTSTIPKVFNVLLLNSSSDEAYSHVPLGKRQGFQKNDGENKCCLVSAKSHHMIAVPCIESHDLALESLLEESNKHETSILGNLTSYTSCSYVSVANLQLSSIAEKSFSISNAKISQSLNKVYSSCIDTEKVVFTSTLSNNSSIVSMKRELAVPHLHSIALGNFQWNSVKLFEYFGFATVLVGQRYGDSYQLCYCYQCCLYVCYCNNAWLIVAYHTIFKHASNFLSINSFFSAYFSRDGVQRNLWFAQYTECTLYDQALNTDSMCRVGLAKMFGLVGACNVLHVNVQHKSTNLIACWMSKLEFAKSKHFSISLRTLCTKSVLCLQGEALFGQPFSKGLPDVKSNLTSYHHISIPSCFSYNQKQIKSIDFYVRATQYNLRGSCIDSYNAISQYSNSVVSDESSTGVHTSSVCQHRPLHTALLPCINCKHTGVLSTDVITTSHSTLTHLDIKKQQKITSFKRYSNFTPTQSYHYCCTYGIYYKGFYSFYACSTMQKQASLSIQFSLHLLVYHNTQPVLTLQCTCKYIYHQLCIATYSLCNGEAVVDSLWNVLPCSFGSCYFPRKQSIISTMNAQEPVLDVPMLRMQDNLCSKDTASCLTDIGLASSCKNDTIDVHFKRHCTLPVETIQDNSNSSKKSVAMERCTNLPFNEKESSSQETILNNKVTDANVNTTFIPAKNYNITVLNATRSSAKEASSKFDIIKCAKELVEWLFLHTGKGFISSSASSIGLFSKFLSLLEKEWLPKPLSATESCNSCFDKLPIVGNLVTVVQCLVTLCTDHASTVTMVKWQSFHHKIAQYYGHAGTTPLVKFVQHEHWHLATQCVQVNSNQHCNVYLSSVQVLAVISTNKCVDHPCIAYSCQIRGRIIVEQFQVMQYKQNAFCCQELHLYSNSIPGTWETSEIYAQQKISGWFGTNRVMPETPHQADDNLLSNAIGFKIHNCSNDCITKPVIICPSVDLQLAGVQASVHVSLKVSAIRNNLHQLNSTSATSVDQGMCRTANNFDSGTSSTVRDNVPRKMSQRSKMSQYSKEIYSSCISTAEAVFSLSDSGSVSNLKTELTVPHVHNLALANLPCYDAKLFEYFGFSIVVVVQRYDVSCYQCCLYVCYCNNVWLTAIYQTIVKHAGNLPCINSFISAYFSTDALQRNHWFPQCTECTLYDQALNTDSMCTVSLAKMFALVDACKMLHVNVQHKSTNSNVCWMSKLEVTKPKQPSVKLRSSCTEVLLCLQGGSVFGQPLSNVLSDTESNLTSCHHISIPSHFSYNQEQIASTNFYAQATQYNLQGSSIDSYNAINQCSVSVVQDKSSTVVHFSSLCQHRLLRTALLFYINCKHTGAFLSNVITTSCSTRTYLDITKQQKITSFKRYSNFTPTQSSHYCCTCGMSFKGFYSFYACSTVQKQASLSIQCSLHLLVYHNTQPVLTLQCTCKYIYHQLCNAMYMLCNGEAVVDSLWNVLPCSFGSCCFPRKQSIVSTMNAQEPVLDVPMLRMHDNLCSKDTASCLTDIALASSCKNDTTGVYFKWHYTIPVETMQETSNSSKETMERYRNLAISVAFDDKESSSHEISLNNINALNATRSSAKEVSSKFYVMKCTKKLDGWPFLHTDKGFICNSAYSLSLLFGKQWSHQSLSATELCNSYFNKLPLFGNLVTAVNCQVTLCTDHGSTIAMVKWQSFHHKIGEYYGHIGISSLLLKFIQHEQWHLATQCVQVNSSQPYNVYLSNVQVLVIISANKCVDQLCIAYNRQIRGRIVIEQFQVIQYKQYTFCCREFHLYNTSMPGTWKISEIDAQQKRSGWFGIKKAMPEKLHQADDHNSIQFKIHNHGKIYITKPAIIFTSVDLQLANVQASVSPKLSVTRNNLHQLNGATSADQCMCHTAMNFDNGTSCTTRDNVPRTTKPILISSHQDEQLHNAVLTTITCKEQLPSISRDAFVVIKHIYCGSEMPSASTCVSCSSHMHGHENVTIWQPSGVPALTKGTYNYHDKDRDTCDKQSNNKFVSCNQSKDKSSDIQLSERSKYNGSKEVRGFKTDSNGSNRNHDDDNHDKKDGFTPAPLILLILLVILIILLLPYLILLRLPGNFLLQHANETHSCSTVTINNPLFNMHSKRMCQVITPQWTDIKYCYNTVKPHSRKSYIFASASMVTQILPQYNLSSCKCKQISIPDSKALVSRLPQHELDIFHKSKLMIIIKRKSHRMQTRNSNIAFFQCTTDPVSDIYKERLQQTPRIKRLIPLLQQICTCFANLNDYSLWRELHAFCFTLPQSRLQTCMLYCIFCLTSVLNFQDVSQFYDDATLHQLMKPVYSDYMLNQFLITLQCSSFDKTLKNPTFSHYLSKPCYFIGQTKQLYITCTLQSNGSHSNSNQYSNIIINNKCKIDEIEYENNPYAYLSAPSYYENNKENRGEDFTLTYKNFLLMGQVHVVNKALYYVCILFIIHYLWHTFESRYYYNWVAFDVRSEERRYLLSRAVLIDRITYQLVMFKLKPRFSCKMVPDYYHDNLYLHIHYKPLNAYLSHFLLRTFNTNIAHCQVIASISTDKRLISKEKGLIILQHWLIKFLFILSEFIVLVKFTSYRVMNYQARDTTSKFPVKGKPMHCTYALQLVDSNAVKRIVFSATHRWMFHIETKCIVLNHSILEIHSPIIQWLSNFSGHDCRILHQSINDYVHFKKQFYSKATLNHMIFLSITSELLNKPATGCCLQESEVDTSGSQHSLLHFTNTIKAVPLENRVDMFRPIGELASGCTIRYYLNQGTYDGEDMFDTWQLVIGRSTLYDASGNQTLQNENQLQHHGAIIAVNNANPFVNFGPEALQNIDVLIPPGQEVSLDDDFHHDNILIEPIEEIVEVFIPQRDEALECSQTYLKMVKPFPSLLGIGGNTGTDFRRYRDADKSLPYPIQESKRRNDGTRMVHGGLEFIIPNEDGVNFSCHTNYEVADEESCLTLQSSKLEMANEELFFSYETSTHGIFEEQLEFDYQSRASEVIHQEQFQLIELEGADT